MRSKSSFILLSAVMMILLFSNLCCTQTAKKPSGEKQAEAVCEKTVEQMDEPKTMEDQKTQVKTPVEKESEKPAETVRFQLRFSQGDKVTYRQVVEARQSISFEGPQTDDPVFAGGAKVNKVELEFLQEIENVDGSGNAQAKITIKSLKYFTQNKDDIVFNFDSSRQADSGNPMMEIIGKSYTVMLSPIGRMYKIVDVSEIRTQLSGKSREQQAALGLFRQDVIERRHSVEALPYPKEAEKKLGSTWSKDQTFSFPIMGPRAYEKIYTFKNLKQKHGHDIAHIEMQAIPDVADETSEQMPENFLSRFDVSDTYVGQLKFDANKNQLVKHYEKLDIEYLMVDPEMRDQDNPRIMKLGAVRLHSIEKVD